MLDLLKATGYELPPRETDYSSITVKQVFDKIEEFMSNAKAEWFVYDFWQLITDYPVSMCQRKMSDGLTFLITLFYHYKIPTVKRKDKLDQELWDSVRDKFNKEGMFTYEQLGLLFMRSKASIHDAIKDREPEIRDITREVNMRSQARSIALQEMVKQEKISLSEQSSKENPKLIK